MKRISSSKPICENVVLYDKNDNKVGELNVPLNVSTETSGNLLHEGDEAGVRAHYYSNTSKFVCDTHIDIPEESDCKIKNTSIKIRKDAQGDNKFYCAVNSKIGNDNIGINECWIADAYYKIDYIV